MVLLPDEISQRKHIQVSVVQKKKKRKKMPTLKEYAERLRKANTFKEVMDIADEMENEFEE